MGKPTLHSTLTKLVGDSPTNNTDTLLAREPIFDLHDRVVGYEVLFRATGAHNQKNCGQAATSTVLMEGFETMRPVLRPGQRFFINFTEEFLVAEVPRLLPPDVCGVEILETVQPSPEVLTGIKGLRTAGYTIALDDFIGQPELMPFLPLVDIVKVEVLGQTRSSLSLLMNALKPHHKRVLAEKVESKAMAQLCRSLGFCLFQGYFFSKGEVIKGKRLSPSQSTQMKILAYAGKELHHIDEINELISSDVVLAYSVLKYINSVYFGLPTRITSIQHALRLIGPIKVMQWVYVNALAGMDASPMIKEIVYLSAHRAKFLEMLAKDHFKLSSRESEVSANYFMLGLFSLLEHILEVPFEDLASSIACPQLVTQALAHHQGPLSPWLDLMLWTEEGEWDRMLPLARQLGLSPAEIMKAFREANIWCGALHGTM